MYASGEIKKNDKYACGFELEVEGGFDTAEAVINKFSESVFVCKEDGSLNHGFEVVSHPFTWAWYKENKKDVLEDLLSMLSKRHMKSHDSGTCGLHIHINKRAFTGSWHIYKFAQFIFSDENADFIRKLSRRKNFSYCRLSLQDGLENKNIPGKIKKPYEYATHYDGVSLSPSHTIELRICRGSLKPVSFFASVEFAAALFEFTKANGGRSMSVDNFLAWLDGQKFETLKKYIIEKELDPPQRLRERPVPGGGEATVSPFSGYWWALPDSAAPPTT